MDEVEIEQDDLSERQLVTFYLGQDEFGVDIMHVREIIRLTEVTSIPKAPSYVEGVCNLRGSILPIIDGRARLGMPRRQREESTRVLVLDVGGKATGFVVDRVSEVLRVSQADIEAPPAVIRDMDVDFLNGMVKLNGGKRIIMALNLSSIVTVNQIEKIEQDAMVATIARRDDVSKAEIDEDQLVTFLLGQEEYAFDIMHVKEIIRVEQITAVPNVADYIEGVVAIRNHLLPIINMRLFFGMENIPVNDQARIIIVDLGQISAGFRVDKVSEVVAVPRNVIEPPPLIFSVEEAGQIRGVAKLSDGKRLLMCLNATKLLPAQVVQELLSGEVAAECAVANSNNSSNSSIEEEQLVAFKLGNEEFAIKITDVQEINRMTEITHMPNAPVYIDGLVNLRGNIIPALNLRRRFGLAEKKSDDATRIIIVDVGSRKTGIVVDAVSEVLRFERSLVEEAPQILSETLDAKYISGVGKLNGGKRMVMIIDLAQVLRM